MTGKQIAENLRQNKSRWTRYRYSEKGSYCVIGLKLCELGVPVDLWGHKKQSEYIAMVLGFDKAFDSLTRLQRRNDLANNVDDLINWCESQGDIDFPLEEAARVLREESRS